MYQLEYDDSITFDEFGNEHDRENGEPDSPVADKIQRFERLGIPDEPQARDLSPTAQPDTVLSAVPELIENQLAAGGQIAGDLGWGLGGIQKKGKKSRKKKEITAMRLKDDTIKQNKLTTNTLMYALADKYDVDGLKMLAKKKFAAAAIHDWDTTAFAQAALLAFTTTPTVDTGLREVVIDVLNDHRDLLEYEEIQVLLNSGNGLAWALLKVICNI